jgi:AcrR family transcriptional regulator
MAKRARARPDPQAQALDAALHLASTRAWREIGLEDIRRAAKIDPAAFSAAFASKQAIVTAVLRRFDAAAIAGAGDAEAEESVRDRLFAILMSRFDAIKPHRRAVRSILSDVPRDPAAALCFGVELGRSMQAMLKAAGASAKGPAAIVVAKGLIAVYAYVYWAFAADETEDLAKTMAALDRALGWAESFAGLLPKA